MKKVLESTCTCTTEPYPGTVKLHARTKFNIILVLVLNFKDVTKFKYRATRTVLVGGAAVFQNTAVFIL